MVRKPRIYSTEDARRLAKQRLPRMIFDFVEGATGRENSATRNETRFDEIFLQPRALADVSRRSVTTELLGRSYGLPVGIAPMGMCNLACPGADALMAHAARERTLPVCLSSAASSNLEDMREWAGDMAWFQLYFGKSKEASFKTVERVSAAGYDTLVLTVDVPEPSRRIRDQRNGFNLPFRMTPGAFLDFALHPRWSISTLAAGVPRPRNFASDDAQFDRKASRAGADWDFLAALRDHWQGNLVVKGITAPEDAARVLNIGADAIYVSNHGGRQLDSAPPAIDLLPIIRDAVGPDTPLLFDSGLRNGEDVVKALALGADFVMLGRPVLYALAAAGGAGLASLLQCFADDIDLAMAQIGARRIADIGAHNIFNPITETSQTPPAKPLPLAAAN